MVSQEKISKLLQVLMNKSVLDPKAREEIKEILADAAGPKKEDLENLVKRVIDDIFRTLINNLSPDEKLRLQVKIDQTIEREVNDFLK